MKKKTPTIEYDFLVHNISEGKEEAYMAIIPAFNNAMVFGKNIKELEEGIRLGIETEIKDLKKTGKPIPKPDRKSEFSGKLIIRIAPKLHARLSLESKARQVSLNRYIEEKLGGQIKT
jgi:predicted HicB family RNase H-like nuclease